jgi:hypothetical protein
MEDRYVWSMKTENFLNLLQLTKAWESEVVRHLHCLIYTKFLQEWKTTSANRIQLALNWKINMKLYADHQVLLDELDGESQIMTRQLNKIQINKR